MRSLPPPITQQIDQLELSQGTARFWIPSQEILVVAINGYFHQRALPQYMNTLNTFIARAKEPLVFADWSMMKRYDSQSREALTRWVLTHRHKIKRLHVLVNSPIVAMGVTIANAFLRDFMLVTTSSHEFRDQLRATLADRALEAPAVEQFYAERPAGFRVVKHPIDNVPVAS
jgi:hypothetical protein